MCYYEDVLGQGAALVIQIITFAAIVLSIVFWSWVYKRYKVGIMQYIVPIAIWVAFGTLDIIITARGTIGDPMREGNPLTRGVLLLGRDYGPALASILWISLWALIVLIINKRLKPGPATFISLAVFYSLATGHFLGFSSWFSPLCGISTLSWAILPEWLIRLPGIIVIGILFAAVHTIAVRIIRGK